MIVYKRKLRTHFRNYLTIRIIFKLMLNYRVFKLKIKSFMEQKSQTLQIRKSLSFIFSFQ